MTTDAALADLFRVLCALDEAAETAPASQDWRGAIVRQATQAIGASTAIPEADADPRDMARRQLAFARAVFDLAVEAVDPAGRNLARSDIAALQARVADFQARLDAL